MAQSGNTGKILTRNDLVLRGYKKAGLVSEGESLTAQQSIDGQNILNDIIYDLINKNIKLWKRKFATLFLIGGQTKYTLGGDARCAETYIETTTDTDALSTDMVISVTSTTGITACDEIGIMVGNDLYWYHIAFVSEGELTLTTELGVDVSDGSAVYTYTSTIDNPLHIDQAMIREVVGKTDNKMLEYSRDEYFTLSNKSSEGIPYNWYQDRRLEETDLFLYTTPQNSSHTIELDLTSPLFITDSPADQMDAPREYTQLIIYSIADELCLENGVDDITSNSVTIRRTQLFNDVSAYDNEETSIFLSPNMED